MDPVSLIFSQEDDINVLAVRWGLEHNGVRSLVGPSLAQPIFRPWSVLASDAEWRVDANSSELELRSGLVPSSTPPGPFQDGCSTTIRNSSATNGSCSSATCSLCPHRRCQRYGERLRKFGARGKQDDPAACGAPPRHRISRDAVFKRSCKVRAFAKRHGRIIYKHFMPRGWDRCGEWAPLQFAGRGTGRDRRD